jgi:hypothetical protein
MAVRTSLAMTICALGFATPTHQVSAQGNPIGDIVGGAVGTAGAVVGGASRAAGAVATGTISAATGVALGGKLEPRAGGFYWYDGHCYRRSDDGSYHTVATPRCG